jgi:HlyD family secretion protein
MRKRILIAVVVLAVLGAGGTWLYRTLRAKPDDRIAISGNIEMTEVQISFKTAGKLIERTVDEGDHVKKGQVIARLDREQLLRQRQAQEAALASTQAQLAQAETAVHWQREQLTADLAAKQADLNANQARLRELQTGSRPEEIRSANAAVEAAQAEFDRAKSDWERAQKLIKNDDITRQQYDQFRTHFESSQAALNQAQQQQRLVKEGPRVEQIDAQKAMVQRASANLRSGQANELELKRREQELAVRRAEIERAKAQIELIDSQLADTIEASPVDGLVLSKSAEVGEVLAPGTAVVAVGDVYHPWLRGYINERDLGRVKIGTPAKITTDSFPGKIYPGKVTFIASEAEFTPKQIQTQEERVKLVYRIKIEAENPNQELKSNMPVEAELELTK